MSGSPGALNETGPLTRVVMKHARDAFVHQAVIEQEWRRLGFTAPPDIARAIAEYERFVELIRAAGAAIDFLPVDERTTMDSIYVRDASIVSPAGVILANMGKRLRSGEPAAQEAAFRASGVPIAGAITKEGRLEGGDLVWLDPVTVAVGEGYRTNAEGIRQLRQILGPAEAGPHNTGAAGPHEEADPNEKAGPHGSAIEIIVAQLPHWHGAGEVLHLMSFLSPVDRNLAVVYSPLMPVPFRQKLLERGYTLVEVPAEEFDTMATNVLAIAPRRCIMLAGNPKTRAALERAGAEVFEYEGAEISVKGAGGPTCLTRPIVRSA